MQTGYVVPSSLVFRTISRFAAQQLEDHHRFLAFADMAGIDVFATKTAAQVTPEEQYIEKSKEKRHRGRDKALSRGFAQGIQDMLEDHLPFTHFEDNPEAAKPLDDFYRYAYKAWNDRLPARISRSLRDGKIIDVSATDIGKPDPETLNRLITDMFLYFRENPEKLKSILVKTYSRRQRESDADETRKGRGTAGVAQAYFQPRMPREEYEAAKTKAKAEGDKTPQNIDRSLLDALQDRGELKWEWKGIDENKRLHFTLPEISGDDRVYRIEVPPEIQNIRPGTYTFQLGKPGKRGVQFTFKEQREDIFRDTTKALEETGIAADQLKRLPDHMVNAYMEHILPYEMSKEKLSKMIEDFGGQLRIKGKLISDADDLSDLAAEMEEAKPKGRGAEKSREWTERAREERLDKVHTMTQKWGPQLAQHFLKTDKRQGERIVQLIASKFPETSQKGTPSVDSIVQTRPIAEIALRTIVDPDVMPAGGGKRQEWRHIAIDRVKEAALRDAAVRSMFERLGQVERLKAQGVAGPEIKKMLLQEHFQGQPGAAPLADQDIRALVDSIPDKTWSSSFNRLNQAISNVMHSMKDQPEIQKFFERARTWRPYLQKQIDLAVSTALDAIEVPVEKTEEYLKSTEGVKLLDKTRKDVERAALKQLYKKASETDLMLIRSVHNRLRGA